MTGPATGEAPDLFAGTARDYRRHRPPYPRAAIEWIVAAHGLDGTGRMIDVGCGTGQLILPLAAHVGEVVGIDPDPAMLAEAARAAAEASVANVRWRRGRAEELNDDLAPLRIATFGASFHWTDRTAVAERIYDLLAPGSGMVILSPSSILAGDAPWKDALRATIREFLGEARRAGSGTYAPRPLHEECLALTRFPAPAEVEFAMPWAWTARGLIGLLRSTSFASRAVLGRNADAFDAALAARLGALSPGDRFEETVTVTIHSLRKPAA